jgi:hypothetical protein
MTGRHWCNRPPAGHQPRQAQPPKQAARDTWASAMRPAAGMPPGRAGCIPSITSAPGQIPTAKDATGHTVVTPGRRECPPSQCFVTPAQDKRAEGPLTSPRLPARGGPRYLGQFDSSAESKPAQQYQIRGVSRQSGRLQAAVESWRERTAWSPDRRHPSRFPMRRHKPRARQPACNDPHCHASPPVTPIGVRFPGHRMASPTLCGQPSPPARCTLAPGLARFDGSSIIGDCVFAARPFTRCQPAAMRRSGSAALLDAPQGLIQAGP